MYVNKRSICSFLIVFALLIAQVGVFPIPSAQAAVYNQAAFRNKPEPLIVVLVSFTDSPIGQSTATYEQLVFGNGVHSVNDYFKENSNGQFYFKPVQLGGNTTGIYNVTLDAKKLPPTTTAGSTIIYAGHAVDALQNQGVDLFSFDVNHDNALESTELNTLFVLPSDKLNGSPFYYRIMRGFSSPISRNGVAAAFVSESNVSGTFSDPSLGVISHELSHSLGLHDMYSTPEFVYDFSLMSLGAHSSLDNTMLGSLPTHLDPWSKAALGWVTPTTYATATTLYPATNPSQYNTLVLPIEGLAAHYFMIERRKAENFDASLAMQGRGSSNFGLPPLQDMVVVWLVEANILQTQDNANRGARPGNTVVAVVPAGGTVAAEQMLCYQFANSEYGGKKLSGYSLQVSSDFTVTATYDPPAKSTSTVVQGINKNGKDVVGYTLDIATERITLPADQVITDYVYNNNGRWTKLRSNDLSRLFTKQYRYFEITTLQHNMFPDVEHRIIFGAIAARPKMSAKPHYGLNVAIDNVVFATNPLSQELVTVETATSKEATAWVPFPEYGIPVTSTKQLFFARTPATVSISMNGIVSTPASKPAKVSVTTIGKIPNLKPNYKTETLPVKAGQTYKIGEADPVVVTRDNVVKGGVNIADAITSGKTITVYTTATAKKPESAEQIIEFPTRATMPDSHGISYDGKKWAAPKTLEFLTGTKWGSLPKTLTTGTKVRVKPTKTTPASLIYLVTVGEGNVATLSVEKQLFVSDTSLICK